MTPRPGRLHLVDTSVLARTSVAAVRQVVLGLLAERSAATCATVDLEAGYSGRTADDVRAVRHRRPQEYEVLPLTERAADRARDVQVLLAERGVHRAAGVVDLLTAAVAELHGAVVLHYDADFEHVATVTGQEHRWVAPRGSLG